MIKNKIILLIFTLFFINNVYAETIIYDNITTSNYKFLIIEDKINIEGINEYQYNVLINGSYYGTFNKGDKIFYPENSTILIQFNPPIKTNINDVYSSIIKPTLITGLGFFVSWGLAIIIILLIIYRLWKYRG